jgi:hypothetical protein
VRFMNLFFLMLNHSCLSLSVLVIELPVKINEVTVPA